MASMTTTTTAPTTEYEKGVAPPPPPPPASYCAWDALLRVVLLVASVVAVVVMVTSNETKLLQVQLPGMPGQVSVPKSAKFHYSPAFIYLVAALSVAGLYSIITGLVSLSVVWKPSSIPAKYLIFLILSDVLILGVVASATGAAGGVAYVGLKGNSHVNWNKTCDPYGKFCRYVGSSVAVSLFASFVLVLLILGNAYSLYLRVDPKS